MTKYTHIKDLRISQELLIKFFFNVEKNISISNGLPDDAKCVGVYFEHKDRCFHFHIESSEYPEVPDGQVIPWANDPLVTEK